MITITLEEHYASPAFMAGPGHDHHQRLPQFIAALTDVGAARIAAMDAAGIDVQVLSLGAPGVEQLDATDAITVARESNDFLADAISHYPTRLAAFAAIPTPAPDAAAAELERAVRQLGFKGAMIHGHVRGRYLDDQFFSPILERAEALDVPLYIHPTQPPRAVVDAYYGGFAPPVSCMFANAGCGWHIETAVHVIRLVLGGAFDRFPKLQIV